MHGLIEDDFGGHVSSQRVIGQLFKLVHLATISAKFASMPRFAWPLIRCRVGVAFLLFGVMQVLGAESDNTIPWRQDAPPNDPYSPQEAVSRISVPDGFTVELVASEPDIVNPIAMAFDDRGRIWVTESVEYPRKEAGIGRDRVKVLEDTNGDGRADKVTVFA